MVSSNTTVGFIGLGVMGEPMCRNIARHSGNRVIAFDPRPEPLERLAPDGVETADSIASLAREADIVVMSLPGGEQVREVALGRDGIGAHARAGTTVVDTSTCPVSVAREVAAALAERGMDFADAPIARTRAAAEAGTLSIMVGGTEEVFGRIRPLLGATATDITHCGPVGCGQVVKLLNNMVLFETVAALAEAMAIGRRAGMDLQLLLETLSKGSADSFALRNHGMKAMLPGAFPENAFSTEYALKDVAYALDLAGDVGVDAQGARLAQERLKAARELGYGKAYFPAVLKVLDDEAPGKQ